jgi:acyl transferase domain-containing protein/acyl carrier protein
MTDSKTDQRNGLEIAIIGMAGRFPGASSIYQFWENLRNGVESITFVTDQNRKNSAVSTPAKPNFVYAAGLLDRIDQFDASFFGYSPREAEVIDPQQRLFLETAWEALEAAGWSPSSVKGLVGVYAGVGLGTYLINLYSNPSLVDSMGGFQIGIGNDKDHLTSRVSYKLNLEGPSVTVQTTCSTSLVAVHLACQALLSGECDMALAGGVTVEVQQRSGYFYREGGILSPDGHCRAFDADARGTVGGSGVGVVVLKRLEDSISDGDCVQAVIKGSALNNDGGTKVGYTAPRIEGQSAVIKAAQLVAEVDPETITYVEAHGTGTEMGDPIEVAALTRAFRTKTERKNFCALGSVKTNVGHLDAAAGVAGLIKTVLALKHKEIPPSLHFSKPNPKIDFGNSPFYVNDTLRDWAANGHPRRAGVSSFGIGGTNAHIVLEEAPIQKPSGVSRAWQLLSLSAKTETALDTVTANLVDHLKRHRDVNLADVAFTLHNGRASLGHRRTVLVQDMNEAIAALERRDRRGSTSIEGEGVTNRPVIFMFPGQGTQYPNMGRGLYESEGVYREQIDLCARLLESSLGIDLRDVLYPKDQTDANETQLKQTEMAQPTLFVTAYALARLWMSWGVLPCAMIGHSIGEYVAACLSGVFTLADALETVAVRGRMIQQLPKGGMLAVPLAEHDISALLAPSLTIAAVNEPSTTVVSGPLDSLEKLERQLEEQGLRYRRLNTSHAFHSEMMDPIVERFAGHVSRINLKPPRIPFVSNVTGNWITDSDATDPNYWSRQLREPVRFAEGLRVLLDEPDSALLEIGPGRTLGSIAQRSRNTVANQIVVSSMRHPDERTEDVQFLVNSLGQLWLAGVAIDWDGFYSREERRKVQLPTYPFERQRYWIERNLSSQPMADPPSVSTESQINDWFYLPSWKRSLTPTAVPSEISTERSPWLLFIDGSGQCSGIVDRLDVHDNDVFCVTPGEQFRKLSDHAFEINPRLPDHYGLLLDNLATSGKFPKTIVHLWNVTQESSSLPPFEHFQSSQDLGFLSLLFLVQALGKHPAPVSLQVVSSNTLDITGDELLCPEKATVLGVCRVIPQEYPNLTCRSIDITIPELGTSLHESVTDRLVAEFMSAPSNEVVAYRGNHRMVEAFDPVLLEDSGEQTPRLRRGGVYLITGGLGWIGLNLAEYLAKAVQARLILIGRSTFPERELWADMVATGRDQDEVRRKIMRLQAIEEAGAEVLVLSADVSDEDQMRRVIEQTLEKFGAVNGVIHAAGFVGEGAAVSIQLTGRAVYDAHIGPKVRGLYVLEQALRNLDVDFYVLCSSLSAVLGGLGLAGYSAANVFMDCFAHQQSRVSSAAWISVNWDGWQRSTDEDERRDSVKSGTKVLLAPGEGIETFRRALATSGASQIAVSRSDLDARIRQWVRLESLHGEGSQKSGLLLQHARPNLSTDYVPPRNELENTIARIWKELLGVDELGIDDNFFELGGHSLLAIQVISRLRDIFEVELPIEALFEAPTVAELGVAIVQAQIKRVGGEDMSDMLAELEQLSEDEAVSLLMNKAKQNG